MVFSIRASRLPLGVLFTLWACFASIASAQPVVSVKFDIEKPPFEYSKTADDNAVSNLIRQLDSKALKLDHTDQHGYLRSLLAALDVPEASQTLVFSKTSLQVRYISPRNPRAIYFNDDVYVGWVRGSSLVEISTADPKLGAAFYLFEMSPSRPRIRRADYDCLGCHATSLTQGVPGHTIRSVMTQSDGRVLPRGISHVSGDDSPFQERFGGWYVTGSHGDMKHLGNATLRGDSLDTSNSFNLADLNGRFPTEAYLTPHSDIVALMVLQHQTQLHNRFTRADFQTRQLLHDAAKASPTDGSQAELQIQLRLLAAEVVEGIFFCDESLLTNQVRGNDTFPSIFTARGPKDSRGRTLREFDLHNRLFKYPCSYLVHSDSFAALHPELRRRVISQMLDVLHGRDPSPRFAHLNPPTRQTILDILQETEAALFAQPTP